MSNDRSQPTDDEGKIGVSKPSDEPPQGTSLPFCGDLDMRIARDGTWYYLGSPIGRKPLVKLFSSVLQRDDDGQYWLVTPVERGRVVVDDAPFTAVELSVSGTGRDQTLRFRTNIDAWVEAGPAHPIRVAFAPETGEPTPYILVRDRLEALILRPVYYELANLSVTQQHQGEDHLGIWSNGTFFPLDLISGAQLRDNPA